MNGLRTLFLKVEYMLRFMQNKEIVGLVVSIGHQGGAVFGK